MHIINACVCKYACFFDTLYHYALTAKVETQDFASHKGGCAINRGDYIPVIAGFTACETQDFASLLWITHT